MSDYDNDEFEQDEVASQETSSTTHLIRLMIEIKAIKDLEKGANIQAAYTFLAQGQTQSFKTSPPTPVTASKEVEVKNGFAAFELKV